MLFHPTMEDSLSSPLSRHGTEINVSELDKAGPSEEKTWRLNFAGIQRPERPQRGPHYCFTTLGLFFNLRIFVIETVIGKIHPGVDPLHEFFEPGWFLRISYRIEQCPQLLGFIHLDPCTIIVWFLSRYF